MRRKGKKLFLLLEQRKKALVGLHNGNPGISRAISLLKDIFYWLGMNKAIDECNLNLFAAMAGHENNFISHH